MWRLGEVSSQGNQSAAVCCRCVDKERVVWRLGEVSSQGNQSAAVCCRCVDKERVVWRLGEVSSQGNQSAAVCCRCVDKERVVWRLGEVSSQGNQSGSLRAKFDVTAGPSRPATAAVQFKGEGSTLSGVDFELIGPGYRTSLVKKRFLTGESDDELLTCFGAEITWSL